ncbi:MAG: 50S ribosomal protein L11 methyltransferase [Patescibacteria group bacterium]
MFIVFLNLVFSLIAILILIGVIIFLIPAVRWLPFVPSEKDRVGTMVELARIKPGEKAVDLGSGDGRIVIALAQTGAEAHGYEINPLLVWWSRYRIKRAGLTDKAFIHQKDFWQEDLSQYQLVVIYGISFIMSRLEKKLTKELKSGARVVINDAVFPNLKYSQKQDKVYLYRI